MTTKTLTKKPTAPAKANKNRSPKRATPKSKKNAARPKTKLAIIRGLLERPNGAAIAELTKATKWQAHSIRAALTGLRKAGADMLRTRDDGGATRYRIGGVK